ncbi:MAG: tyrosine-type recombinase/integrase [Desulfomonilaceae bacterium]
MITQATKIISDSMETPVAQTSVFRPGDLVTEFLRARKDSTKKRYKRDLDDFRSFVKLKSISEAVNCFVSNGSSAANSIALAYKDHLIRRGLAPRTINNRMSTLRGLTKTARLVGRIDWWIDVQDIRCKTASRDTRGPGRQGFQQMVREAELQQGARGLRDVAILRLLYDLALRAGEVSGLDIEDVRIDDYEIRVLGKGDYHKTALSLPKPTWIALENWLRVRGAHTGPVFVGCTMKGKKTRKRMSPISIYKVVRSIGERVGIRTRPHGLRHTAISEAVRLVQQNGMDLTSVLKFSRHSNMSTLQYYIDQESRIQGKIADLVAAASE